jgi:S-formylglutathione hydrolase FrmB
MFYVDQPWAGNCFGEYIGRELVEFTRKTFPLSTKREDTYIGGLSMGGYGALRNGLKYSDTFGAIVGLSSAMLMDESLLVDNPNPRFPSERLEWRKSVFGQDLKAALESDKNPRVLIKKLLAEGKTIPDIFLACGTEDFLYEKNVEFVQFLKENNVPVKFVSAPGSHEWDFWDTHIKEALNWLPLEDASAGKTSGNIM